MVRGSGGRPVLAAIAALGMAADFALALPTAGAVGVWAAWIAAGTLALSPAVIVPLFRCGGLRDLAAVAERGDPELGERLTSAVELLGDGEAPHGSPALIAALGEDAARRAAEADLDERRLGHERRRRASSPGCGSRGWSSRRRSSGPTRSDRSRIGSSCRGPTSTGSAGSSSRSTPGDKVVAIGSDVRRRRDDQAAIRLDEPARGREARMDGRRQDRRIRSR